MNKDQFKDKRIAILGFGVEGKSTLNFLINQHFAFKKLSVLDTNTALKVNSGVELTTGSNYLDHLEEFDVIFKSPGVPYSEKLLPYRDKILTQIQFFFDHYQGKIIALTASKGKSTMSSLVYMILKDAGYRVCLLGNIGTPILDIIDFETEWDFVVCEVSSYMLEGLKKKNYLSLLGSIFPEHMDWHGGLDKYFAAKLSILEGSEYTVILEKTLKDFQLSEYYENSISYGGEGADMYWKEGFFTYQGKKLFSTQDRLLLGEHNLQNIAGALAIALKIGIDPASLHHTVRNFKGLPHRIEYLGTYQDILFYDDAISTSPESTIEAINTFGSRIDTIFLGGLDRGYDFHGLVEKIKETGIRNFVFFPDTGKRIAELLKDFPHQILYTTSMEEAVAFAYRFTEPGKICLLSTASPSYSLRKNFEAKGKDFQQYVQKLGAI